MAEYPYLEPLDPDRREANREEFFESSAIYRMKIAGGRARNTYGYREVLDPEDIPPPLIASPDGWHSPMLRTPLDAGKDIYLAKRFSHVAAEP